MFVKEVARSRKIDELFSVKNKIVLVCGAGALGGYMARGFLENGAYVVITCVSEGKAQRLKNEFAADGLTNCDAYTMDQTSKEDVQTVVDDVIRKHGKIDVLIATGALCWNEDAEDFKEDGIRQMMDVNITGIIFITQVVGKTMIANGGGRIIQIGSIGGLECHSYRSMPYEASKAAVHQLTKSFATAWAHHNINVNCIAPTWINTPLVDFAAGPAMEAVRKQHLFGRVAEVEDFLGAALFLASDASTYVSGHILTVDGGWSVSKPWSVPGMTPGN